MGEDNFGVTKARPEDAAARGRLGALRVDHPPRHGQPVRRARPVLVLGVDAPGAGNDERHDLAVTRGYWASLPEQLRRHLRCPVVDRLVPITQKHTIEGLVMGEA